jgi:hypothetical protein
MKFTMKTEPPFIIFMQHGENQGDGVFDEPMTMERFGTLGAASAYIQLFWQGLDWMEGTHRFYTDFGVYILANFSFESIGRFVQEPGKNSKYYFFNPVTEADRDEADNKHSQGNFRKTATCDKCGSRDLAISEGSDALHGIYKCRACGYGIGWVS